MPDQPPRLPPSVSPRPATKPFRRGRRRRARSSSPCGCPIRCQSAASSTPMAAIGPPNVAPSWDLGAGAAAPAPVSKAVARHPPRRSDSTLLPSVTCTVACGSTTPDCLHAARKETALRPPRPRPAWALAVGLSPGGPSHAPSSADLRPCSTPTVPRLLDEVNRALGHDSGRRGHNGAPAQLRTTCVADRTDNFCSRPGKPARVGATPRRLPGHPEHATARTVT